MDTHLRIFCAAAISAVFLLLLQYGVNTAVLAENPIIHNESIELNPISYVPLPLVTAAEMDTEGANVPELEVIAEQAPMSEKKITAPTSSPYGRLVIPSINLSKDIGAVGLTSTGNMDVLNDPTRVGWYNGGAIPGKVGSAVIGAHVYQAFGELKNVQVGDDIYVERKDGSQAHFVVQELAVYQYTDTAPLNKIFNRTDAARLNLITCYGKLTADRSTYTHRFVVYATLVM